jgi:hypothetical protein
MAANADSVIVELQAKVDQFDQPIKQSAAKFDASMKQIAGSAEQAEKTITAAHGKMSLAANQNRIGLLELQHVMRGSVDQFASGAPITQIFAQHIASVGQAASLSGGSLGAFGAIMSGPWGLAVTAGIAILATLISKHHDAGDAVDGLVEKLKRHHQQTEDNTEAQRIYDRTVSGSIDAMKKLTDEIDKQNLTLEDNIALKKAAIAGTLADVVGNIGTVSTQLSQAILAAREAQRLLDEMQSGGIALGENPTATILSQQTRLRDARQSVIDLTAELVGLNTAAEGGARALRSVDFPLVERNAKNAVNPIAAINTKYDEMADKAKKAGTYTQALADSIERMRQADLKAAQQRSSSSGEYGRSVSFGDAEAIARGAGLTVTSGYRSTADQARLFNDPAYNHPGNPVARPGTSAHEGVNGKWALDIAFAPGLSAQSLKKLYGDEGVTLSAVYKETGHFHIEGRQTQGEIAANKAAEAQAAAEQRLHAQLTKSLGTEQQISVVKENQAELSREITGHVVTLDELLRSGVLPSLKSWEKEYDTIIHSQEELNRFGGPLIDEVLNPDNWSSWGDMGKRILHELEVELITLAAINPLKNLLTGGTLPTLGGVLGKLGGLFGSGTSSTSFTVGADTLGGFGTVGLDHLAGGGTIGGFGGTDNNVLSINGQPRAMVSGNETLAVIPSNARAASPASAQVVQVLLGVEASEYFDARVLRTTGPVIAQSSVAAANGGASIGRRNLERESRHRL